MMRVLVTGDRNWEDKFLVSVVLRGFQTISEDRFDEVFHVIQGGAKGADEAAREWCMSRPSVESVTVEAEWDKHGKAAGPLRNIKMFEDHDPEFVLAFHDDLESSKGTKHCVQEALKRGLVVYRFGTGGL